MTWFWWWSCTPAGWRICFRFGPVEVALTAQLPDSTPTLDLSDEQLAEFISHKWDDIEFPQEMP